MTLRPVSPPTRRLAFSPPRGQSRPAALLSDFQGKPTMTPSDPKAAEEKPQRLHLVFGGELKSLDTHEFRDPSKIDIVGLFPDYASAEQAWRAKAQQSVDSAQTRYFIVHLHRLIEPDLGPPTRIA
jgi:Domain of unknown function (DUF4170)